MQLLLIVNDVMNFASNETVGNVHMEILIDKIKGLLPSQRLLLVVKSYLVMSVPLFKVAHKLLI